MSICTTISKLNEHNYQSWAIEAKDSLRHLNVWHVVASWEIIPHPPAALAASGSTTTHTAPDLLDSSDDFQPPSTDSMYLTHFDNSLQDWGAYCNHYANLNVTICALLELSTPSQYKDDKINDSNLLWQAIQFNVEKVMKFDGQFGMVMLTDRKLKLYPSIFKWITALEMIINDIVISDITMDDAWRIFYIPLNLPTNDKWRNSVLMFDPTQKADMVANITSHLLSLEATLRSPTGLAPYATLFVRKKGNSRTSYMMGDGIKGECWGQKSQGIACHGCGKKRHIKQNGQNRDKWASDAAEKKSKVDAIFVSTASTPAANSESFVFSIIEQDSVHEDMVIMVNVATLKQSPDNWNLDSSVNNLVTGNCHLF